MWSRATSRTSTYDPPPDVASLSSFNPDKKLYQIPTELCRMTRESVQSSDDRGRTYVLSALEDSHWWIIGPNTRGGLIVEMLNGAFPLTVMSSRKAQAAFSASVLEAR